MKSQTTAVLWEAVTWERECMCACMWVTVTVKWHAKAKRSGSTMWRRWIKRVRISKYLGNVIIPSGACTLLKGLAGTAANGTTGIQWQFEGIFCINEMTSKKLYKIKLLIITNAKGKLSFYHITSLLVIIHHMVRRTKEQTSLQIPEINTSLFLTISSNQTCLCYCAGQILKYKRPVSHSHQVAMHIELEPKYLEMLTSF